MVPGDGALPICACRFRLKSHSSRQPHERLKSSESLWPRESLGVTGDCFLATLLENSGRELVVRHTEI